MHVAPCSVPHRPIPWRTPRPQVPQAAEQGEVERLHRAAALIQQTWRTYCARKALRAAGQGMGGSAGPSAAAVMGALGRSGPPRRLDSMLAAVETVEGAGDYSERPLLCLPALLHVSAGPTKAARTLHLATRNCLTVHPPPLPCPAQASHGSWWTNW